MILEVMKYLEYEKIFRNKATDAGFSEDNIVKCLRYAKPLIDINLPVIYNTANLAAFVGYKKSYLKRAVQYTTYFYREFKIKKKNGKTRIIKEPLPSLKEIQHWILENILNKIPVSNFSKAYIKNKSIKDNARFHQGQKKVLALDIEDFFPSITFNSVEKIFLSLGYSNLIGNLMAKLCTLEGKLPQGAPTSPYISNIFLKKFDLIISEYCKSKKIRFTRYADDLTFSGDFDEKEIIDFVKQELSKLNLNINEDKSKVMLQNERQVVTGVVVNDKMRVARERRKELRQAVYYIEKFGLDSHLEKIKCNKRNYIRHLLGIANFILFINPKDEEIKKYKNILKLYLPEKGGDIAKDSYRNQQ
jgi:RNA-directed DNA polymerase